MTKRQELIVMLDDRRETVLTRDIESLGENINLL
jgi:hypothetical protein